MHFSIKNIAKVSVIYSLGQWASAFLGVILIPVYTRIFSTEDYGVIDLIGGTTVFLVVLLQLGMDDAVTRFFCDTGSEQEKGRVASAAFLFKLCTYIPLLAVGIILSRDISVLLFGDGVYGRLISYSFASVFTTGLYILFVNLLRLRFKTVLFAVLSLLQLLSQLLLTLYFVVWARTGIVGIYWAAIISMGSFAVLLFFLNRPYLRCGWNSPLMKTMLLFGIWIVPSNIAYILMQYLDRYFINYYRGLSELGVYAIGYNVSMVLLMATAGFNLAWGPFVYASYARPESRQVMARTLNYYNSILSTIAVAIALFSVELLKVFTTAPYYGAARVVGLVIFGLLVFQVTGYFSVGIGISKKMYIYMWCGFLAVAMNCLLNWLLIPRYGIVGAAWATFLSYVIYGTIAMTASEFCFHIPYAYARNLCLWLIGGAMVAIERLWLGGLPTSPGTIAAKALLLAVFFLLPFLLKMIPLYVVRASIDALTGRNRGSGGHTRRGSS